MMQYVRLGEEVQMGPDSSHVDKRFPHRKNRDGTYDSICTACMATIASCDREDELASYERKHVCDESTLLYLKNLQKQGSKPSAK